MTAEPRGGEASQDPPEVADPVETALTVPSPAPDEDDGFLEDLAERIDALRIITERDESKANAELERLGVSDRVELEMAAELARPAPLADPDGFPAAHRAVVMGLEVYDRHVREAPAGLRAGFLRPVATVAVQFLVSQVARIHQRRVVGDVRELYAMREAASVVGSREHRMLASARRQIDALAPDLVGRGLSLPAFLVGGAALSAVVSFLQEVMSSTPGRVLMLVAIGLLALASFWSILTAAAVMRRRTRLALDGPLTRLWDVVGAAGDPPRERSRAFVLVATGLLVTAWVLAPLLAALLVGVI